MTKKKNKILIPLLIIFLIFMFLFIHKRYFKYKPDYQRVSVALERPQKEISFEVDVNKWDLFIGYHKNEGGSHDGNINMFHKSFLTTNEDYDTYPIFFSYTYNPTFADCGDTGADCDPYVSGEYIPKDAYFVDLNEETRVYVPTINSDGSMPQYFTENVLQITQDNFGGNRHKMNFLNPNPGVSTRTDYFEIDIGEFDDNKAWKKEIEPALIHALETFEIKDLKKEKPE